LAALEVPPGPSIPHSWKSWKSWKPLAAPAGSGQGFQKYLVGGGYLLA
jgi:hypothetical protein